MRDTSFLLWCSVDIVENNVVRVLQNVLYVELNSLTKISDYANPKCEECDGEGIVSYARGEDAEDLPCQVCFPDGFEDDYDDKGDDE